MNILWLSNKAPGHSGIPLYTHEYVCMYTIKYFAYWNI